MRLIAAVLAALLTLTPLYVRANDLQVTVASGALSGLASRDGLVRGFKGIPYAAPPVGALRWRPPQPVAAWQSEDCPTLKVWTAVPPGANSRPVMVFFHGGGNVVWSGSMAAFDGSALARKGAVVVTLDWRLGSVRFPGTP